MSNKLPTQTFSPRPKTGKRPYEPAQWSLGWKQSENTSFKENHSCNFFPYSVMKYHNESAILLQDKYKPEYEDKKVQIKKNKTDQFNSKLPTFDPKNANKTHIVFGTQRENMSQRPSGMKSPRMPPGGKTSIIFG